MENLLTYDYYTSEIRYGAEGRIQNSNELLEKEKNAYGHSL